MITDNTAKWQKKKLTNFASNEALPVGHIYQSLSKNVPVGSLPLLGGEYDRTLYADLWSWANENGLVVCEVEWQSMAIALGGSCALFSDGNGSTTFRVPALKCWVKGANSVDEVGSYLQAGLPNITGSAYDVLIGGRENETGAFDLKKSGIHSVQGGNTNNTSYGYLEIDASRCSSVYRNDITTVQPPSIVGMWVIVAYGSITNIGSVDVVENAKEVNRVSDRQEHGLRSFNTEGHLVLPDGSEFWIE